MYGVILAVAALAAPADAKPDDVSAADLAKMQGDWMVVSMKASGTEVPDDEAQALFRTVKENRYSVARYSKVVGSGTFKIDAAKMPRTIDSQPDKSPDGKPILGIYEFDGDKLRVCNALPGKPRPTTFDAKLLSGHTVIVWEPEKR
jgi:uncharacterized protein (TIGR03067 family)